MIYIKILIFLHLQSIIRVKCQLRKYELHPQYFIPTEELVISIPKLDVCISSFKYAEDATKIYLGLMSLNQTEYIYAEIYQKYNINTTNSSCALDDRTMINSRNKIFIQLNQFMILINGCFKINNFIYEGVLVLMEDNWQIPFLQIGINHWLNISTFNKSNLVIGRSKKLESCHIADCTGFGKNCLNILSDLESSYLRIEIILFFIVLSLIVIVCWPTCIFLYYNE